MIIRQATQRQGQCIFCKQLIPRRRPIQPMCKKLTTRTVMTRAELAIPRHNLLEERITGPNLEELRSQVTPVHPFSSPKTPGILQKHRLMEHWRATSGNYGSTIDKANLPGNLITTAPSPDDVTLELLMASQAHMGHSTSLWNPMNSRYIFGVRHGIHIISLEATASHLKRAARVIEKVCENGGVVLFVGTRKGQRNLVVTAAEMAGGCHLFSRWVPGTISNGQQLLQGCRIAPVTPLGREVTRYEEEIKEKVAVLKPDIVVILNPLENNVLLHECAIATIPTIGVIDTDADPTRVTYPIPANDDSQRCLRLISGVLGRAGERGKLARMQRIREGKPVSSVPFDLIDIAFEEKRQKWANETGFTGDMADRKRAPAKNAAAVEEPGSADGEQEFEAEEQSQAWFRAQLLKEKKQR